MSELQASGVLTDAGEAELIMAIRKAARVEGVAWIGELGTHALSGLVREWHRLAGDALTARHAAEMEAEYRRGMAAAPGVDLHIRKAELAAAEREGFARWLGWSAGHSDVAAEFTPLLAERGAAAEQRGREQSALAIETLPVGLGEDGWLELARVAEDNHWPDDSTRSVMGMEVAHQIGLRRAVAAARGATPTPAGGEAESRALASRMIRDELIASIAWPGNAVQADQFGDWIATKLACSGVLAEPPRADLAAYVESLVDAAGWCEGHGVNVGAGPGGVLAHVRQDLTRLMNVMRPRADTGECGDRMFGNGEPACRLERGHSGNLHDDLVQNQWPATAKPMGRASEVTAEEFAQFDADIASCRGREPDNAMDGAAHSVWLHGKWRWLTQQMTTPEREAFAAAVVRHSAVLEPDDPVALGDLRWWNQAAPVPPAEEPAPAAPWRCIVCGSADWVGWRAGPEYEGYVVQRASCVPCGQIQALPAEYTFSFAELLDDPTLAEGPAVLTYQGLHGHGWRCIRPHKVGGPHTRVSYASQDAARVGLAGHNAEHHATHAPAEEPAPAELPGWMEIAKVHRTWTWRCRGTHEGAADWDVRGGYDEAGARYAAAEHIAEFHPAPTSGEGGK